MNTWPPHRMREALLADVDARLKEGLASDPVTLQFDRARLLTELGRANEARQAYLAILQIVPDHFGALNNLGALLHADGYRTAARTVYARAAEQHSDNPVGHVNYANALLAGSEWEKAKTHYERALTIDPHHAEAHQGLANLLQEIGDEMLARDHRRLGFKNQVMTVLPYRGAIDPIPVLLLISAAGGNIPFQSFLDDRIFQTTVIVADFFEPSRPVPQHSLIVNSIGDADLCINALTMAAQLLECSKTPLINAPAAVLLTGRVENARRFAACSDIIAPRMAMLTKTELVKPDALARLADLGFSIPFLLRVPGIHTGRHFHRIENADELVSTVASLPGENVLIIQYLDSRGQDGKIRKYRVMIIDGILYPLHLAIANNWKIHYFTADMANDADNRAEDDAFLNDMPKTLGARAMAALEYIRDTLGLDYAGVDFGLDREGRLLFYEANATMVVNPPEPDPRWDYRRVAVERVIDAIRSMLLQRVGIAKL